MDSLRSVFDVGLNYAFSPRRRQFKGNPPKAQKKLPLKQKKSNYGYQLNSEWNTSAQPQLLFFSLCICGYVCVHVHAPVFAVFVSTPVLPSGPLKLHTLLSGLSSQQAHLEMRFKTAINIELYGEKKGSDFKIVLSEVGPNHNWASGEKKQIERRNGSD